MVKTLPISEAREQLRALVEQANRTMARVIITRNGKPEAVLMGYAEYESWLETLDVMADHDELAAIEAGLADVRAGRLVSAEDAYREAAPPKDTPLEGPGNIGSGG
ncbi:MAG TPA: type II toxin-antitoxin system Phd/YefM family antitoxin, partial [Nitrospira sp.]|nr:type II toxin-antitoxin system Phd/YefM family antitoxin [Nitrospira sp.]